MQTLFLGFCISIRCGRQFTWKVRLRREDACLRVGTCCVSLSKKCSTSFPRSYVWEREFELLRLPRASVRIQVWVSLLAVLECQSFVTLLTFTEVSILFLPQGKPRAFRYPYLGVECLAPFFVELAIYFRCLSICCVTAHVAARRAPLSINHGITTSHCARGCSCQLGLMRRQRLVLVSIVDRFAGG
jgi:hypothetical protein